MKKIALFGGSFDPPHFGHIQAITSVINSNLVDEIWIVPVGDERYDRKPIANSIDRIAMLKLIIEEFFDQSKVKIEDLQTKELTDSTTIGLADALIAKYTEAQFSFVIGADNISNLNTWKSFDDLIKKINFIAVPRLDIVMPKNIPEYVQVLDLDKSFSNNISSSGVRLLLKEKLQLAGLLPKQIEKYILDKKIYF